MRRLSLVGLVLAAGCVSTSGLTSGGDAGTSPEGGAGDGGTEASTTDSGADAGGDAGPTSGACDLAKPFGTLQPFGAPINQSATDETAGVFTDDRLRFYFASTRTTSGALFVVERATPTSPWGAPSTLSELDSAFSDNDPSLTPDEKTIFFDSKRSGDEDLWLSTRSDISASFGVPVLVQGLSAPGRDRGPWISRDAMRLYFGTDRATGNTDLVVSTRAASGVFDTPVALDALNSPGSDDDPITTGDELTIYFASDRPGGSKDYDVYVAHRANAAAAFGAPTKVDELSSTKDDYVSWVSPDGCAVVVESYVSGSADLYYAEKPK